MPLTSSFTLLWAFVSLLPTAMSLASTSLTNCLTQAHVPFLSLSSAGYAQEISTYNVRTQYKPQAVATPNSTAQISSALNCAAEANITVQAKGGGHSFTGFSQGGRDGAFTISLENFQEVLLGPQGYGSSIAKVGAGLRLGNMASSLYNKAQVGLPHGSCPGVGIGGHATHGGFGFNSRAWGLAMDSIVAMDVVLPNGTSLTVNPQNHPDLWFAFRGAADSFGIATNFFMQTRPVPTSMVFFGYHFGNIWANKDPSIPTNMLLHLQSFGNNASVVDGRLTFNTYLDGGSWSTSGQFQGTLAEFNSKIAPELLRTMPKPTSDSSVQVVNWTKSLALLAGSQPLISPHGAGYNLHDDFFAKSIVVPQSGLLNKASATAFFTYIIQHGVDIPSGWYWYTIFDLWGGPGSAINKLPAGDSAFHQRDTFWTFQNYGYAIRAGNGAFPKTFPSGIKPFVQGLNDAIPKAQPQTQFGMYSNYLDDSLTPAQAHQAYFGADNYARLLKVKKVIDPGMLITNPLGVGM